MPLVGVVFLLPVLLLCLVLSPGTTNATAVSYAPQAERLDHTAVQQGAKCLAEVQDGALVPESADANNGIVINIEGCYDHVALGLQDVMVFMPLAERGGKVFHLPSSYNATWVQPNYFPSFGSVNDTDYVLPESGSGPYSANDGGGSAASSFFSSGSGTTTSGGSGGGGASSSSSLFSPSLLEMYAQGESTQSVHLLRTLNVLQDLCAAQCQSVLFYPPSPDGGGSNRTNGSSSASQQQPPSSGYIFRFVIAYGNCYCLNETWPAYSQLNPSTSLPCCIAAPGWIFSSGNQSMGNNSNYNISTLFPASAAPRCSSSKLYGVMYAVKLACPTNATRCGGGSGSSSSTCRIEKGCCVQHISSTTPAPVFQSSVVTIYLMTLVLTAITMQILWWTFRWYALRRRRRNGTERDGELHFNDRNREMNELQLFLMRQAIQGWGQPPLATSRTKDEAVEAAGEAMALLEVVDGDQIPPEDCCPMCLDELPQQPCVKVLCGHVIHSSCMKEFLSHKLRSFFCPVTCPMCRATVLVQQPVEDSPTLNPRESPPRGGEYVPPMMLNGEEVVPQMVAADGGGSRRRRRFRHLSNEEIARANLIIARLLHHRNDEQEPQEEGQLLLRVTADDGQQQREDEQAPVENTSATELAMIADGTRSDVEQWLARRSPRQLPPPALADERDGQVDAVAEELSRDPLSPLSPPHEQHVHHQPADVAAAVEGHAISSAEPHTGGQPISMQDL